MNIVLFEADEISASGAVGLSGARATHLISVLKVAPGQSVRVGVIDGPLGTGTVHAINRDDRLVQLRCTLESETSSRPCVDLLLAVPRPKVLRRLWAQLAAVGVGRIMLTNAERVERHYFDTHILACDTYRPLLIEGLQQARDTRVPEVSIHRRFKVLVEDELDALCGTALRLVADPAAARSVNDTVLASGPASRGADQTDDATRALIAIGPEGGWNAFELALLEAHGFEPVGIGTRTLRTDTATITLLGLVHDAIGRRDR
jgi:RsmE family RNA methyltransferase